MPTLRLVIYLRDEPAPSNHICTFHGDRHKLANDLETRHFLPVERSNGSFAMIATQQILRLEFDRVENESADELRRLSLHLTPEPDPTAGNLRRPDRAEAPPRPPNSGPTCTQNPEEGTKTHSFPSTTVHGTSTSARVTSTSKRHG